MSQTQSSKNGLGDRMDVDSTQLNPAVSQLAQSARLDGDDGFEEFPIQAHALQDGLNEAEPVNVWEDNWDDEMAETDFSKQLKEELEKHGHKSAA